MGSGKKRGHADEVGRRAYFDFIECGIGSADVFLMQTERIGDHVEGIFLRKCTGHRVLS